MTITLLKNATTHAAMCGNHKMYPFCNDICVNLRHCSFFPSTRPEQHLSDCRQYTGFLGVSRSELISHMRGHAAFRTSVDKDARGRQRKHAGVVSDLLGNR